MAKKVIVLRSGLTTCPSCMSHITLHADLAQTECPFCQANLVDERRQDGDVFGHNTLQTLKKSKSAMLAAALGVSLSVAACSESVFNHTVQPPYGGPPLEQDDDMSAKDMDEDVSSPEDMDGGMNPDQDLGGEEMD